MSRKKPSGASLTEYALLFGILAGVAIMNFGAYQERVSDALLGASSSAFDAAQ